MMDASSTHSSSIVNLPYGRVSRRNLAKFSPEKLTFSGNFTPSYRQFNIPSSQRASMRKDILDAVMKKTETVIIQGNADFVDEKIYIDDNPMYEDPRDVIGEKPPKPPRKRNLPPATASSPRGGKERSLKKKLTKKYEGLIAALIDRCEDNVLQISEKDNQIVKLREKLKTVLEYNKLFAEENDQLKTQYSTLAKYVEECKRVIREEREKNVELEETRKQMEDRIKRLMVPDRGPQEPPTAIPLVEVCMSCSSRQIILNQAREHNARLQRDMQALKDVLYRLNVQLSRYQEKIRANVQTLSDKEQGYRPGDNLGHRPGDNLDSLISASLGYQGKDTAVNEETQSNKSGGNEGQHTSRVVDLSGLLSAQALAPLFDAYQENLQEKDSLIADYEKQFENINRKSKQIVLDNKALGEKAHSLEEELGQLRQSYRKLVVERETTDIEKCTLVERAERAESKLKEVYELYEGKMAAMMRDYETVHREYFAVKSALEQSEGKVAQLDVFRARTVPADLHERRLDHCKQLLEELKHQYTMENERRTEQMKKLEEQLKTVEEKYNKMCKEHDVMQAELNTALKNVKLYRKAAVIFRARHQAAAARAQRAQRARRARRSGRAGRAGNAESLKHALQALDRIKGEIKEVKSRARVSLEELERRIVEQERRSQAAQTEYRRELERAEVALEHKEAVIRSLVDKVADIEQVETNHRLLGITTESDSPGDQRARPGASPGDTKARPNVKLVPGSGGYFQEDDGHRRKHSSRTKT